MNASIRFFIVSKDQMLVQYLLSCILTGIPIKFACQLKNVRVKEKSKARMECEMSSKDVHIKWLKDGRDITNNPRYIFMREGKHAELIIEDCDLADDGEYSIMCTQDNDAQEYVSSANLTVDGRGAEQLKNSFIYQSTNTDI